MVDVYGWGWLVAARGLLSAPYIAWRPNWMETSSWSPEPSAGSARCAQAGVTYGISPERAYANFEQMMEQESKREDAIDFVCIVTPNHLHLPVAVAALEHGFHVMSDKPATATLEEAQALEAVVRRTGLLYALTFTYTGYPLVREARLMARGGALGKIRKAVVQYSQGWLSDSPETKGQKQAVWRSDPAQSGLGGAIGDIGVHAFNLLEYVSGRRVAKICADLSSVIAGRALDDDCNVLLKLDNGAPGVLFVSQIAAGDRNDLQLLSYGEKGGLHWWQENPNYLDVSWIGKPSQTLHAGGDYLSLSPEPTFVCPWVIRRGCWRHLLISIATSPGLFEPASAIRRRNSVTP